MNTNVFALALSLAIACHAQSFKDGGGENNRKVNGSIQPATNQSGETSSPKSEGKPNSPAITWSTKGEDFTILIPPMPRLTGKTLWQRTLTSEQRKQLAAAIKAYYEGLRNQVPNLKPTETEWLEAEEKRLNKLSIEGVQASDFFEQWGKFKKTPEYKIGEFFKGIDGRLRKVERLQRTIKEPEDASEEAAEMGEWLDFAQNHVQFDTFNKISPLLPWGDGRSIHEQAKLLLEAEKLGVAPDTLALKKGFLPYTGLIKSGSYIQLEETVFSGLADLMSEKAQQSMRKKGIEPKSEASQYVAPLGQDPSRSIPYIVTHCVVRPYLHKLEYLKLETK